jgi:hypothetical protein
MFKRVGHCFDIFVCERKKGFFRLVLVMDVGADHKFILASPSAILVCLVTHHPSSTYHPPHSQPASYLSHPLGIREIQTFVFTRTIPVYRLSDCLVRPGQSSLRIARPDVQALEHTIGPDTYSSSLVHDPHRPATGRPIDIHTPIPTAGRHTSRADGCNAFHGRRRHGRRR